MFGDYPGPAACFCGGCLVAVGHGGAGAAQAAAGSLLRALQRGPDQGDRAVWPVLQPPAQHVEGGL